jgi:hypothetical protein
VIRHFMALLALVLAGALVACNGGGDATPTGDATGGGSPVAQATDTAAEEATPEETAAETDDTGDGETPNPLASFDLNQDRALEDLLPDEVGGAQLQKFSFAGEEFFGTADEEFQTFLERVGATSDDVSAAFAGDQTGEFTGAIFAIRVAGADTNELEEEFRNAAANAEEGAVDVEERNVGGKDVWTGFDPEQETTIYFYAAGDILFFVQHDDEAVAEEILSQMP